MADPARDLSLEESGALALEEAAQALDSADDKEKFLEALQHNRRVWAMLADIARRENWSVPDDRETAFALGTTTKTGINDDEVHALMAINRRVSQRLAGGELDRIRERAYYIWEARGRPMGKALDHWLLAEMEIGPQH